MKKLLGFVLGACVSFGLYTASADAATVVDVAQLNVRTSPTATAPIIGNMKKGQSVTVTKRLSGWLQVKYNGKVGYIFSSYTKETAPQTAAKKYYVKASSLNVRSGAGTKYGVVGKLRLGQAVTVTKDMGNGWMQISFNGKTAYVSKQYMSPVATVSKKEFVVEATSYTPYESTHGITAMGFNVKKNPYMKLIAVDPKVIPLGSKVWVEGYGEAIAGDTGGAIKGNRIDVLLPTKKQALQWGRKHVKVRIL